MAYPQGGDFTLPHRGKSSGVHHSKVSRGFVRYGIKIGKSQTEPKTSAFGRKAPDSSLREATETSGQAMIQASKLELPIMRYELTNDEWAAIKPRLPNKPRGIPRVNDRRVLNGICWVLRSGAPWRDLPHEFGPYPSSSCAFCRVRAGTRARFFFPGIRLNGLMVKLTPPLRLRVGGDMRRRPLRRSGGEHHGGRTLGHGPLSILYKEGRD